MYTNSYTLKRKVKHCTLHLCEIFNCYNCLESEEHLPHFAYCMRNLFLTLPMPLRFLFSFQAAFGSNSIHQSAAQQSHCLWRNFLFPTFPVPLQSLPRSFFCHSANSMKALWAQKELAPLIHYTVGLWSKDHYHDYPHHHKCAASANMMRPKWFE